MQQYIYGNIGHKGYVYVSSEQEFFMDAKHAQVLNHLMNYDGYCLHGELSSQEHQCFWMVTTDLDVPGDPERLYLQVSGGEFHRGGFYVQGYMSDAGDGDLYGSQLIRLLKTRFHTLQQTMDAAEAGGLRPVRWEDLPVEPSLQAAQVDAELLRNVLLALMQGKRVVIRIPAVGAAAMRQSRELLLAIYERLPYAQRRMNGFITGASAAKLFDRANALPAAVTIVLMDGDADVSGVESDMYQKFFDLAAPAVRIPPMPRENKGKPLPYVALMDFLAEQPAELLDEYFQFCQSYMRDEVAGTSFKINDYLMLMDFFSIGRREFTDELIRIWAGNLFTNKWSAGLKSKLYDRIAGALQPEVLESYLLRAITGFASLSTLGVLVKEELGEETVRDTNAALTMRMAEALTKRYPAGTREKILDRLADRFADLCLEQYDCFGAVNPTAATARDLQQFRLPQAGTDAVPLVTELHARVASRMNGLRQGILDRYQAQLEQQRIQGCSLIGQWDAGTQGVGALYENLGGAYLSAELMPEWNTMIAQKLAQMCADSNPRTLEEHLSLSVRIKEGQEAFAQNGGQFTEAQLEQLRKAENYSRYILELSQRECRTAGALLDLFEELDQAGLEPAMVMDIKTRHAERGLPEGKVLDSKDRLCRHAMSAKERPLLRQALASVEGLDTIPEGMPLKRIVTRLSAQRELVEAGLLDMDILFCDWGRRLPVNEIISRISGLRSYRRGRLEPDLGDERMQQWVAEQFDNTDLLLLLARKQPNMRERLVVRMAQDPAGITKEQMRSLYLAGCSRRMLRAGAGEKTSLGWKAAVEDLFDLWPVLPPPMKRLETSQWKGTGLIWAETVLLALAGLLPAVLMMLLGGTALAWGILLAVQAALAAGCFCTGLVLHHPPQKKLLLWLSLSLLPGVAAAVVMLVLAVL